MAGAGLADDRAIDKALRDPLELGVTRALLLIQNGAIVAEHYGGGCCRESTHRSWSMAKSWAHALVGVLVHERRLALDAPAPVAKWCGSARRPWRTRRT